MTNQVMMRQVDDSVITEGRRVIGLEGEIKGGKIKQKLNMQGEDSVEMREEPNPEACPYFC